MPADDQHPFEKLTNSAKDVGIVFPHSNGDLPSASKMAAVAGPRTLLVACFLGIFGCYFAFGILQETITKAKYGEKEETFHYTQALVFVQCVTSAVFARIAMVVASEHDHTPQRLHAVCSMSYLGAMLASNHALQHVSYPTQVLGKSVKPIPVMILGVLVAGKRYPAVKYLFVLMIVMGVALFIYKDKKEGTPSENRGVIGPGEILLLISLTLDGLTGASQDKMRDDHKTGALSMMYAINIWSMLWLAVGLLYTGELLDFLSFVERYPYVLGSMLMLSVCSAAGQMFIFRTVVTFGPLTCSIFTTTRKFFTILCSIAFFGHPIVGRQWVGTVFVFVGLFLDSLYGKARTTSQTGR